MFAAKSLIAPGSRFARYQFQLRLRVLLKPLPPSFSSVGMRCTLALAALLVAPTEGRVLRSNGTATTPCPASKVYVSVDANVAGTPTFTDQTDKLTPGQCVDTQIAARDGGDILIKLCGPGSLVLSRMTCKKHDYKAVSIDNPTDATTIDVCTTHSTNEFYQVKGYVGSITFNCDTTAR